MKCKHYGMVTWVRPSWYSLKPRVPKIACQGCGQHIEVKFVEVGV